MRLTAMHLIGIIMFKMGVPPEPCFCVLSINRYKYTHNCISSGNHIFLISKYAQTRSTHNNRSNMNTSFTISTLHALLFAIIGLALNVRHLIYFCSYSCQKCAPFVSYSLPRSGHATLITKVHHAIYKAFPRGYSVDVLKTGNITSAKPVVCNLHSLWHVVFVSPLDCMVSDWLLARIWGIKCHHKLLTVVFGKINCWVQNKMQKVSKWFTVQIINPKAMSMQNKSI